MMKIVIAPDSFKGNLSAMEVARAIEQGVRRVLPRADCIKIPMADGGEGTVQSLVDATEGRFVRKRVRGPDGKKVTARYGLFPDGRTAVIEMAEASGLPLVSGSARNPLHTTTYGTGELIADAMNRGARRIIIGIGGSATNDAGAGMAQALGVRFYDKYGRLIRGRAAGGMLNEIVSIDMQQIHPRLATTGITVACDVDNLLCGSNGASRVYGPQKGATPRMIKKLDSNLKYFGRLIHKQLRIDILGVKGAGAAGGLGGGLMAFCGARLKRGIGIVIDAVGLADQIRGAALVITGEGRVDYQTVFGKTPAGVARQARAAHVPVIAIGGGLSPDARKVFAHGIAGLESSIARDISLREALSGARANIADAAERAMRLIMVGRGIERSERERRSTHRGGKVSGRRQAGK